MRLLYLLLIIKACSLIPGISTAQFQFIPLPEEAERQQILLKSIEARCESDLKALSGPYKKYSAGIYKERYEAIKNYFTEKEVFNAKEAQLYLDALVAEITKANPSLSAQEMRIVFSKSFQANAASMGEGTIFLNIGLFHRLENEAQAAFALCHEIAHYILNHGNNQIEQYIYTTYSEDFQKKLKAIQKAAYGQNKQLESLAQNFTFKTRRHSRQHESAADSVALELLKNTRFDVQESLRLLGMFDSTDKDKFNVPLDLEKRFHYKDYPFKKRWLENDDLVFTTSKETKDPPLADSLKTHPDCEKRIATLLPSVKALANQNHLKFIVSKEKFDLLKKQFDYEIIEHCYNTNAVSRAFSFSLQLLAFYPDDPYLNTMVGKCLNEMYRKQKAHELDKIVDRPNPLFNEEYNGLLRFIQNLSLSDIAALSENFMEQNAPKFANDPAFQKIYTASKGLTSSF